MTLLLREAIGGTLRQTRTDRRRTLREVSHQARVSLGYLSEVERGRKEPSSELLASICDALEVPLPDLLVAVAEAMRLEPLQQPLVPIGSRHADLRRGSNPAGGGTVLVSVAA